MLSPPPRLENGLRISLSCSPTQQAQNICITFVQCWSNVWTSNVQMLYKCFEVLTPPICVTPVSVCAISDTLSGPGEALYMDPQLRGYPRDMRNATNIARYLTHCTFRVRAAAVECFYPIGGPTEGRRRQGPRCGRVYDVFRCYPQYKLLMHPNNPARRDIFRRYRKV